MEKIMNGCGKIRNYDEVWFDETVNHSRKEEVNQNQSVSIALKLLVGKRYESLFLSHFTSQNPQKPFQKLHNLTNKTNVMC